MHVVVVESPAKAKTINKYLGKDYVVLASYGHVRDLPSKDNMVQPDNNFAMQYQVPADSEKNIQAIIKAIKGADTLYLATDLDREGEAISWHILDEIQKRNKLGHITVKRIEFNEITKTAIQHAIAHPRDIAMDLVNAQQARRALDYLVGFNLSPVLWRKVRGGLSAGRVQSVALRMICERELEIKAFVAEEYWTIGGSFQVSQGTLTARLNLFNGDKVEKFSFKDAAASVGAVTALKSQTWRIGEVQTKRVQRRPVAPFTTSTLQQEAARKLRSTTRKTMRTAQSLYEGVDIGGETVGLITYMRTDAVSLSQDALHMTRDVIAKNYGPGYLPEKPVFYANKSKNAQEAHEAVRPTDPSRTPESLKGRIDADLWGLYNLIWQRTMACQMANAQLDQTSVDIDSADKKHSFRASGSVLVFDGFLRVYQEGRDQDEDEAEKLLPLVTTGEPATPLDVTPDQHFTEPPPRFSEATLVKALEENGIGRPSTYSSIISTLTDRQYVRLDQRRFFPEDVGMVVSKFLTNHFATYVDIGFTAGMEDELDAVSRGEEDWRDLLGRFWAPFKTLVADKLESVKKSDVTTEDTGEACPTCHEGALVWRLGRYGKFKGCNRYPECTYIEKTTSSATPTPTTPTGITCPTCKTGEIVGRTSRKGKVFFGCNRYPQCSYAVWDKPQTVPCPTCQWPITTIKETKRQGTIIKCPHCEWQDPPAPEGAKKFVRNTKEAKAKTPAKKTTSKKQTAVGTKVKKTTQARSKTKAGTTGT